MMTSSRSLRDIDASAAAAVSISCLSAKYVRRVRRFVGFLVERDITKAAAPNASKAVNERVIEFQDWLRHHRGISERTIDRHGRMVMRLLPGLGDDPGTYDAELVRRVILAEAQKKLSCQRQDDDDSAPGLSAIPGSAWLIPPLA